MTAPGPPSKGKLSALLAETTSLIIWRRHAIVILGIHGEARPAGTLAASTCVVAITQERVYMAFLPPPEAASPCAVYAQYCLVSPLPALGDSHQGSAQQRESYENAHRGPEAGARPSSPPPSPSPSPSSFSSQLHVADRDPARGRGCVEGCGTALEGVWLLWPLWPGTKCDESQSSESAPRLPPPIGRRGGLAARGPGPGPPLKARAKARSARLVEGQLSTLKSPGANQRACALRSGEGVAMAPWLSSSAPDVPDKASRRNTGTWRLTDLAVQRCGFA
jgi:hypothetical protein